MKLSSVDARKILEKEKDKRKDVRWINHSICVGDAAYRIALALKQKGVKVDPDKAMALGYIHDIGKYTGNSNGHVVRGYNYLKELGVDEEYACVCLTHSYLNNDIMCTAGGVPADIPFRTEYIEKHVYTIEEKIVNLCDLMCTQKIFTLDKRLISIIMKKGSYINTQYHIKEAYKLKKYFDDLLGYNLYDLFPEIISNL